MTRATALSLTRTTTFAVLLAISILAPLAGAGQLVTGTIVNASLIVATVLLGPRLAITIGLLPSLFALMSGQLPWPLAPMVPFIIIGNAILVLTIHLLRKRSYPGGVALAAGFKFLWLYGFATMLVNAAVFPPKVGALVMLMMGWPQLTTALLGGAAAYAILKPAKML